ISKCLYPGFPKKFTRLFDKDQREYKIDLKPINQDKNFNKQFAALDIVKHAKGTEETKNAYVDLTTHDFNVVSEVYGNGIDTRKLKQALMDSVGANEMEFQYDPDDFRLQPTIKANSPEIQQRLEYCKKYLSQEIKLNTFKGPYTIPPKEMNKFIEADAQGNRVIKKKKLKKYVKKLRENFSVSGGEYDLDLVGGHVHVSGGNYGVYVDTSAEYKQLKKDFAAGTNVTRDLLYEGGRTPAGGNDIGNSYVEIDISRQKLWCVVNGKTVVKSDVVTGNEAEGYGTPTGLYVIAYKVSPCTLRGENADGSKYESKVSYWMPFNGGIGCHDATWRGSFGGSIYRYSGSHGCVNMPYSKAEELYYNVDAGMPVVVHN
ncbi:MAG: L,D-transpeptidase, partial [Eubacterium sp.]|nr:L,D-transpeptidase [Eubacterium sp.]